MQLLWNANLLQQNVFRVQLIKHADAYEGHDGGKWTFGGYDRSVIRGALATAPLIQETWWQVSLGAISVGSKRTFIPSNTVIMDSGTTLIVLSTSDCDNIYSALPGGQFNPQSGFI